MVFGIRPIWSAFTLSWNGDFISGNALNLNWIITHFLHFFQPDRYGELQKGMANPIELIAPKAITIVPTLLFFGFFCVSFLLFFLREKTFENLLLFATLGFLTYYMFNLAVHENHLFVVTILAGVLFWVDDRFRTVSVILMLISNINLFVFYGVDGTLHFPRTVGALDIALPLAVFNVVFFFYFFWFVLVNSRSGEESKLVTTQSEERLEHAG
jgi:hypothetical protein